MGIILKAGELRRWERELGYASVILQRTTVRLDRGLHRRDTQSLLHFFRRYIESSNERLHGAISAGHAGVGLLRRMCKGVPRRVSERVRGPPLGQQTLRIEEGVVDALPTLRI
jgi:hypothetical protein